MDDGTLDDAKGRVKEAAGDITDDQSLKNEGKVDRASVEVKDKVGDAADKAKDCRLATDPPAAPALTAGLGARESFPTAARPGGDDGGMRDATPPSSRPTTSSRAAG